MKFSNNVNACKFPSFCTQHHKQVLKLFACLWANTHRRKNVYAHIWPHAALCCPGACGSGRWWMSECLFHNCWLEYSWYIKRRMNYTELRKTKIVVLSLLCQQIKKPQKTLISILKLTLHETFAEIDPGTQREGTNLSKKAASSLLSSTLCLVPALTWQFISWARDIYTEVPAENAHAKRNKQIIHPP